jgi:hypothetical protein
MPVVMQDDVIKVLERELAQLEATLRSNPTYIKIERIKVLLAAYAPDDGDVHLMSKQSAQARRASAERRNPNKPSKRSKVYDVVEELIRSRGPTHRKELLAEVTARGLMGSEKNPMQSIAIYLSDAKDRFMSAGDGFWKLRERSEQIESPAEIGGGSE